MNSMARQATGALDLNFVDRGTIPISDFEPVPIVRNHGSDGEPIATQLEAEHLFDPDRGTSRPPSPYTRSTLRARPLPVRRKRRPPRHTALPR